MCYKNVIISIKPYDIHFLALVSNFNFQILFSKNNSFSFFLYLSELNLISNIQESFLHNIVYCQERQYILSDVLCGSRYVICNWKNLAIMRSKYLLCFLYFAFNLLILKDTIQFTCSTQLVHPRQNHPNRNI